MIEILEASLFMSVQDGGRWGYQRYGVPTSGPMDWFAHRAANTLVKNSPGSACIEAGMSTASFGIDTESFIAVTGAGYSALLNGSSQPMWTVISCHVGDELQLIKQAGGNWAYLAVAGGFDLPEIMGSTSTYAPAGLGRGLQVGDRLCVARMGCDAHSIIERYLPREKRPNYGNEVEARAMTGLHCERFTAEGLHYFWNTPYTITPRSDRMAYRLQGEVITHKAGADIISQGMALGAVQVPADGQPIVMLADHPTTGGYTQVAVVSHADLPLVAQCEPGIGRVKFKQVTLEEAQQAYREEVHKIETGINDDVEDWMLL
jgi:antagonist of KipI